MNILVRGRDPQIEEFLSKFGKMDGLELDNQNSFEKDLSDFDLVFDFFLDESPENLDQYASEDNLIIFCNSVKTSLAEFSFYLDHNFECKFIGFNGMPSFLDRDPLELTLLDENDRQIVDKICSQLGTKYVIVDDRVGMVTPRVICMIINEAYYTVQEGTADKNSIDQAMKLGTNYPFGPFEWAEKIGIGNVYELLEAVYEDTKDERYKICPQMKRDYIMS